jgi:hypothetical protein
MLTHLSPIFDLHLNRARNPSSVDWSACDFIGLIQLTVDTIALSSGLDGNLGAPRAIVLEEMTRAAGMMAPQRPLDEHAHVARFVLDHLLRHDEPTAYFAVERMLAKLHELKEELMRRRHLPIPEQRKWLSSVVRGHCAYYAVLGNSNAIRAFRTQATRHWHRALRRRSQRTRLNWERMDRLATRWLPQAPIMHPWPSVRFDARTQGRSPAR